jgi:hypothetical protein
MRNEQRWGWSVAKPRPLPPLPGKCIVGAREAVIAMVETRPGQSFDDVWDSLCFMGKRYCCSPRGAVAAWVHGGDRVLPAVSALIVGGVIIDTDPTDWALTRLHLHRPLTKALADHMATPRHEALCRWAEAGWAWLGEHRAVLARAEVARG